jgi:hypothetical protein
MENTDSLWIEHVLNPKTITSVYPTQAPSLAQVQLGELSIICGGTLTCRLSFDLRDFPTDAPTKWVQRKCNTVSLALSLTEVTIEQCVIPSGSGVGNLSIVHDGTGFEVAFSTKPQGVVFRARATWISVDSISAYTHELR